MCFFFSCFLLVFVFLVVCVCVCMCVWRGVGVEMAFSVVGWGGGTGVLQTGLRQVYCK